MMTTTSPNSPNIIPVVGDFDALHVRELDRVIETTVFEKTGDVILDMKAVNFMDSSGIGAIVFLYKRLSANDRKLIIRDITGQPLNIAKMVGLDRVVDMETSPADLMQ